MEGGAGEWAKCGGVFGSRGALLGCCSCVRERRRQGGWRGGRGRCCVGLFVAVCWMGTREMLWFVAVVGVGGEGDGGTDVCCCCCCCCGGDYLARLLGGSLWCCEGAEVVVCGVCVDVCVCSSRLMGVNVVRGVLDGLIWLLWLWLRRHEGEGRS